MQNSFRKFKKVPLAVSIALLIFSLALFVFTYQKINSNNKIFEETEAKWKDETSKKNEIKSLERFLKMMEQERILLDSHFIRSSDIVPFLDTIEKLALQVKAKTEVTSVDIAPGNTSLAVGLRAAGTFESLYKFLTLLENSPYQLEFVSMNMKKDAVAVSAKGGETPQWSVVFKIKLLSFME